MSPKEQTAETILRSYDVEIKRGTKVEVVDVEAADEAAARQWAFDQYGDDVIVLSVTLG